MASGGKSAKSRTTRTKRARPTVEPRTAASRAGAKKKAAVRPSRPSRPTAKPRRATAAVELVTIGITPPQLAPDSAALDLHRTLAIRSTRPPPEDIARLPWMQQDQAYRAGFYLLTHGLRKHADHPELELCNVPGALLPGAQDVLNQLSDMVLRGSIFRHGEAILLREHPLVVVGVREIAPGESGTQHDVPVLRVTFLA